MGTSYYDPGEQRAAKVKELFTRIAPRYDLLNDLQSLGLHRRWKQRVIALAQAAPGRPALDVCCGTGDLALALAGRGAATIGLDFSGRMLAVAAGRSGRVGAGVLESGIAAQASGIPLFIRGDAERLPFADNSFEIVTAGYGLRNLVSWENGLREMQRVARPGGQLLVLDFGKPDNPLWRGLYFGYLKVCVPLLGWLMSGSAGAYAYILESLAHYPAQSGVAARMRELGLINVSLVNLLGGVMAIIYGEKREFTKP